MKTLMAVVFSILLVGQTGTHVLAQRPGPRDGRALFEQLGLTPGQRAKLRELLRANRMESERARRALGQERTRLFATYDDYQLNVSRARQSIVKMNRLRLDLLNASLHRQIALRTVLTADQFAQMKRIMRHGPFDRERLGKGPGPGHGFGPRRPPQLDLRSDQRDAVEKFWKSHDKNVGETGRAMAHDLAAINRLYENHRLDERAAKRLISSVNQAQAREAHLRLDWQVEMRKILSEDQFRTLTQHIRKSFAPPRGSWPKPRQPR